MIFTKRPRYVVLNSVFDKKKKAGQPFLGLRETAPWLLLAGPCLPAYTLGVVLCGWRLHPHVEESFGNDSGWKGRLRRLSGSHFARGQNPPRRLSPASCAPGAAPATLEGVSPRQPMVAAACTFRVVA